MLLVLGHLWVLLVLASATEIASNPLYDNRLPAVLEERAVAISYYCCGVLVLMFILASLR